LSNAELFDWLRQSIEAGMLTREQIAELDLIQREQVAVGA